MSELIDRSWEKASLYSQAVFMLSGVVKQKHLPSIWSADNLVLFPRVSLSEILQVGVAKQDVEHNPVNVWPRYYHHLAQEVI